MAENPPPSIGIDPEIQDYKSTIGLMRITVGNPQKNISQFYHQVTQLLYRRNPSQLIQNII